MLEKMPFTWRQLRLRGGGAQPMKSESPGGTVGRRAPMLSKRLIQPRQGGKPLVQGEQTGCGALHVLGQ